MKFNIKYVGPIYTTPNIRESASCRVFFGGGGVDAQEQVRLVFLAQREKRAFFSLSEKNERDLPVSERKNGW